MRDNFVIRSKQACTVSITVTLQHELKYRNNPHTNIDFLIFKHCLRVAQKVRISPFVISINTRSKNQHDYRLYCCHDKNTSGSETQLLNILRRRLDGHFLSIHLTEDVSNPNRALNLQPFINIYSRQN